MRDADVAGTIELLARRTELLRSLRFEPQSKRDLVETMSVSRSTVGRAVRQLEARGFVERRDGTIAISLQGRLALDAYESFTTELANLEGARAVLEPLDSTARMDVSLLRNADVVQPEPVAPNQPVAALRDHLQDASRVRGFATQVLPSHVDEYYERIVEHEASVEFVVTEDVLEEVVATHGDVFEEALETGRFHMWLADQPLDYSLLVVDKPQQTVVCALVYGDSGVFGVLENEDDRAVEWALGLFDELRESADPIPQ
jgi:predicted transcriptional regulator